MSMNTDFEKGFIFTNLTEAFHTTLKNSVFWSFLFVPGQLVAQSVANPRLPILVTPILPYLGFVQNVGMYESVWVYIT